MFCGKEKTIHGLSASTILIKRSCSATKMLVIIRQNTFMIHDWSYMTQYSQKVCYHSELPIIITFVMWTVPRISQNLFS